MTQSVFDFSFCEEKWYKEIGLHQEILDNRPLVIRIATDPSFTTEKEIQATGSVVGDWFRKVIREKIMWHCR